MLRKSGLLNLRFHWAERIQGGLWEDSGRTLGGQGEEDGIHAVHAGNDFVSNRSDSFRLGQFRETAILADDICAGESYPIIYV